MPQKFLASLSSFDISILTLFIIREKHKNEASITSSVRKCENFFRKTSGFSKCAFRSSSFEQFQVTCYYFCGMKAKPVEHQNALYRAEDGKEAFRYYFWKYKIHI